MDPGKIENSQRLWKDYRAAFKDWASEVKRLKRLIRSTTTGVVVQETEDQVKAAEVQYQDTRNRLADEIRRRDE